MNHLTVDERTHCSSVPFSGMRPPTCRPVAVGSDVIIIWAGETWLFLIVPPGPPAVGEVVATDTSLNFWLVYLKYNNGRFFANAEYSWANIDTHKTLNGGPTTD